jgi:hypothetical protein
VLKDFTDLSSEPYPSDSTYKHIQVSTLEHFQYEVDSRLFDWGRCREGGEIIIHVAREWVISPRVLGMLVII